MNYQKHYQLIIDRARNRSIDGYVEEHHILPRCMGGDNDSNNLVLLTPEEHFVAHQLLVKIYPDVVGLKKALAIMIAPPRGNTTYRNNKAFGWIRRQISEGHKGKSLSDEHRRKIGNSKKGKPRSDDVKRKLSEARRGKSLSEETRRKMSEARRGKPSPMKGRTHSIETKRKIAEQSKRLMAGKAFPRRKEN